MWWQERSVEGRLEELVGLYNAEVHGHRGTHRTIHSIDPAPSSPYQPGGLTTIFPVASRPAGGGRPATEGGVVVDDPTPPPSIITDITRSCVHVLKWSACAAHRVHELRLPGKG